MHLLEWTIVTKLTKHSIRSSILSRSLYCRDKIKIFTGGLNEEEVDNSKKKAHTHTLYGNNMIKPIFCFFFFFAVRRMLSFLDCRTIWIATHF